MTATNYASRRNQMIEMREHGLTFVQISHQFGCTPSRVWQIVRLSSVPVDPHYKQPVGPSTFTTDLLTTVNAFSDASVRRLLTALEGPAPEMLARFERQGKAIIRERRVKS